MGRIRSAVDGIPFFNPDRYDWFMPPSSGRPSLLCGGVIGARSAAGDAAVLQLFMLVILALFPGMATWLPDAIFG